MKTEQLLKLKQQIKSIRIDYKLKPLTVGGCVRDELMGKEPKDIDYIVPNSSHEEMITLGFTQVGESFPVYLHPITKDEYALPRVEMKEGEGFTGFTTETSTNGKKVTIEEDLKRRDLTINAIAYDKRTNTFIDPFNGIQDLKDKILRPVSDFFVEDPLRFIRLARFAARYPDFNVDYKLFHSLIKDTPNILKEISELPKERVFIELEKVLGEDKPSTFFRVLKKLSILELNFPYLHNMIHKEQSNTQHAEGDVFEHSLRSLDQVCKLTKNKVTRFGTLIHDLGKPISYEITKGTEKHNKEKYYRHYDLNMLKDELKWFSTNKYPSEYIKFAEKGIAFHHTLHSLNEMNYKSITKLFDKNKLFPKKREEIEQLILVAKSDSFGRIVSNTNDTILTKKEVDKVFENGSFEKNGKKFIKGETVHNVNYEILLDIQDLIKNVNAKEVSKLDSYKHDNGKVNFNKILHYLYHEKLNIIKDYLSDRNVSKDKGINLN